MHDHHQRALDKARGRLLEQEPGLLAILIGGSIAKKCERPDSDLDLIVVLSDERFEHRRQACQVAFLWFDVCDYAGGYVEGRFIGRSFLREAVTGGSDPTRHSFTGVFPVYCTEPDLLSDLAAIPVFPTADKTDKALAFLAQLNLNRWFFWHEGKRRQDRYLQLHAATEIVLFGCRLVLLANDQLFACQKRLVEQTLACPDLPAGFEAKLNRFLTELNDESLDAFSQAVLDFREWPQTDFLSRFLLDVELSWFTRRHAVGEW